MSNKIHTQETDFNSQVQGAIAAENDRKQHFLKKAFDKALKHPEKIARIATSNGVDKLEIPVGPGESGRITDIFKPLDPRKKVILSQDEIETSPSYKQFKQRLEEAGIAVKGLAVANASNRSVLVGTKLKMTLSPAERTP